MTYVNLTLFAYVDRFPFFSCPSSLSFYCCLKFFFDPINRSIVFFIDSYRSWLFFFVFFSWITHRVYVLICSFIGWSFTSWIVVDNFFHLIFLVCSFILYSSMQGWSCETKKNVCAHRANDGIKKNSANEKRNVVLWMRCVLLSLRIQSYYCSCCCLPLSSVQWYDASSIVCMCFCVNCCRVNQIPNCIHIEIFWVLARATPVNLKFKPCTTHVYNKNQNKNNEIITRMSKKKYWAKLKNQRRMRTKYQS